MVTVRESNEQERDLCSCARAREHDLCTGPAGGENPSTRHTRGEPARSNMAQFPIKQGVYRGLGAARVCGRTKPTYRNSLGGEQTRAAAELAAELFALKVDVFWVGTCG